VLWNGGISFGGVIAFIFADLIVIPILNIYRKYYGLRMAGFLFVTFYAAMAGSALIVEAIFRALGLVPAQHNARVVEASVSWNYTTGLNVVFLIVAALLLWRFLKTGGPEMLRMMNRPLRRGMRIDYSPPSRTGRLVFISTAVPPCIRPQASAVAAGRACHSAPGGGWASSPPSAHASRARGRPAQMPPTTKSDVQERTMNGSACRFFVILRRMARYVSNPAIFAGPRGHSACSHSSSPA
jgi:hypothetical protein